MGWHSDNARIVPAAIVWQLTFKGDPAVTGANDIHRSDMIRDHVEIRGKGCIAVDRPHKFRNMFWTAMHHSIAFVEMFKNDPIRSPRHPITMVRCQRI